MTEKYERSNIYGNLYRYKVNMDGKEYKFNANFGSKDCGCYLTCVYINGIDKDISEACKFRSLEGIVGHIEKTLKERREYRKNHEDEIRETSRALAGVWNLYERTGDAHDFIGE